MVIYRLRQNEPMMPDDIDRLVAALNETLRALGIDMHGNAPNSELIAKKIIRVAQTGVRDPSDISKYVLIELLSQTPWQNFP